LFCLALSVLWLLNEPALSAIPGRPDPADVQMIEACVNDAQKDKSDPDACIGKAAIVCGQATTGPSAEQNCIDREYLVWDAAANSDFERLSVRLPDSESKQALRDTQRAYLLAKLKLCGFARIAHKDAREAALASARCNLKTVARYDLWLRDVVNSYK
jgi:uncharacterized protein YecT (DUF1311 family)